MDSPIWKAKGWTMTAMLAAFIQDETQGAEDRDYAATILRWGLLQETLKPETGAWLNQIWLSALWESPQAFALQSITDRDGNTTVEVVCTQNETFAPVAPQIAALDVESDEL
jgi:hypothetical protein